MADRPIHFSALMIRALLDGTKTQTRRVIKPQPPENATCAGFFSTGSFGWMAGNPADLESWEFLGDFKTRFMPGDRLWVRETWQGLTFGDFRPTKHQPCEVRYAATDPCADLDTEARGYPWRPSIFMPRWASRITLTVTDVRVERLQSISEADAVAEGVVHGKASFDYDVGTVDRDWFTVPGLDDPGTGISAVDMYSQLWRTINGPCAWDANQWVAAYTFTVERKNIDEVPA